MTRGKWDVEAKNSVRAVWMGRQIEQMREQVDPR